MTAQTYPGPVRWIVVDDVHPPEVIPSALRPGWHVVAVRPRPAWQPGEITHGRNLLAGLEHVDPADPVVFVEDDDWYAPAWLSIVAAASERADLVGETHAHYYHVGTRRWLQYQNDTHASLCATAMRGEAISVFRDVVRVRSRLFPDSVRQCFDGTVWREYPGPKCLFAGQHVVGMKGVPGRRGGIGVGHKEGFGRHADPNGLKLRELLGADADAYLPFGQIGRRGA
jgi:hypothetical protein